jgi:4-coumarate--CoA ligase
MTWNGWFLWRGYERTEACGIISLENLREGTRLSDSAGVPVPGESQVLGVDTLKPLLPNQIGEIAPRTQYDAR